MRSRYLLLVLLLLYGSLAQAISTSELTARLIRGESLPPELKQWLVANLPSNSTPAQPVSIDRIGGPDGFGYRFIDNQNEAAGPVYDWVEINPDVGGPGTSAGITRDDENIAVPLSGFTFPYYGTNYSDSINICSNGFVGFGLRSASFDNQSLPYSLHTSPGIYPLWDDLNPVAGGSIWYYYDATNNRFIVEWYGLPHAYVPLSTYTFQIRLYATGVIECMYQSIGSMNNSATVGIQGPGGGASNRRLSYLFNSAFSVSSNLAVRFYPQVGRVYVSVRDSASTLPIRGANVDLVGTNSYSASTDTAGQANFLLVRAGNFRMRVSATGHLGVSTSIFAVANNDSLVYRLSLPTLDSLLPGPRNLTVATALPGQLQLRWQRPGTTDRDEIDSLYGYQVYRIFNTDTSLITFRNISGDTSYLDGGLVNGERYGYFVRAVYTEGLSSASNTVYGFPRPTPGYSFVADTFRWVTMPANGTSANVYGDDAISAPIRIGFPFPYYGDTWDSVQICTNGFIGHDLLAGDASLRTPNEIPNIMRPNGIIAGFWADQVADRDSIRYWLDSLNQRFIVTVSHAQFYNVPNVRLTYQYVLYRDGSIKLNYRSIQHTTQGVAWSVGMENRAGNDGMVILTGVGVSDPIDSNSYSIRRADNGYGTVTGTVRYSEQPVRGLAILVNDFNSYWQFFEPPTSQYRFTNVPAGQYSLLVAMMDLPFDTVAVTVLRDSIHVIDFSSAPAGNLPPSQILIDGFFDDRVLLYWSLPTPELDEIDNLTGYKIFRNDTLIATVPADQFSYVDATYGSIAENVYFTYRMTATYSTAPFESPSTDEFEAVYGMPPMSLTLSGVLVADSTYELSWNRPTENLDQTPLTDLRGFLIYRGDEIIGTVADTVTRFNTVLPSRRVGYTFTVTAFDDAQVHPNESPASNVVFAMVDLPYASTPFYWLSTQTGTFDPGWIDLDLHSSTVAEVPLEFTFPYFGDLFYFVNVSSNGFLSLVDQQWWPRQCPGFPRVDAPNGVIAPNWDDLDPDSGTVKVYSSVSMFAVSYENMRRVGGVTPAGSFQVRLFPSGTIEFAYSVPPTGTEYAIGLENLNGTIGYQLHGNGISTFAPTANSSLVFFGQPRGMGIVKGSVTRSTGTPVQGVAVSVMNTWSGNTPQNGQFRFQVPAGEWPLQLSAPCYQPDTLTQWVFVPANDSIVIPLTVHQPTIQVNPTTLSLHLQNRRDTTSSITLSNTGDAIMNWTASVRYRDNRMMGRSDAISNRPLPTLAPLPITLRGSDGKALPDAKSSPSTISTPATDQVWGPDGYGYRAFDNSEPQFPTGFSSKTLLLPPISYWRGMTMRLRSR